MEMEQYLGIFIEESKEHLQNLNRCLLELEKQPDKVELVNEIFRSAHTLKGMSATMGYEKIAKLAHSMESVLHDVKAGQLHVDKSLSTLMFKCLDILEGYISNIVDTGLEGDKENHDVIEQLTQFISHDNSKSVQVQNGVGKSQNVMPKDEAVNKIHQNPIQANALPDNDVKPKQENVTGPVNTYDVEISIDKDCAFKDARGLLILKVATQYGNIIDSRPSIIDIEKGLFQNILKLQISSKYDDTFLKEKISSISEVENVTIKLSEASNKSTKKTKYTQAIRVAPGKLTKLMDLVSELVVAKTRFEGLELNNLSQQHQDALESLEKVTGELHEAVMKVRMIPIQSVFDRFPRMVRDLAQDLGKDLVLHISGGQTELDRTITDVTGDLLVHLLRNSADHGIEEPSKRESSGKTREGNIHLRAYQSGNNVVIEIEDDGNGFDLEKIKQKIVDKGLATRDEVNRFSEQEIIEYLFRSDFSTSDVVTEVSGRGVGLDAVRTKVMSLGGTMDVSSKLGSGTKFTIKLPFTSVMIGALMILLNDEIYAIPLNMIKEIVDVIDIKLIQDKECIILRDTIIPVIRLKDILKVPQKEQNKGHFKAVIVQKANELTGFIVDSLIGQQQIIVKPLGEFLANVRLISGATILSDGKVALIIDVNSVIQDAYKII